MQNRIKEIRQEKKLSLFDLAKKLNISQQAISLYEKGDREPKLETWRALADYFDVSVPYLRGATTYEILDLREKGIYGYVTEAMDRGKCWLKQKNGGAINLRFVASYSPYKFYPKDDYRPGKQKR